MVKSAQCIFSTVPQLQTEEKNFPTFSQFHRPIHHRCLNALKTDFVLTFLTAHQTCLVSVDQGPTFCFIVHVGNIHACQTCSQRGLPNPTLATDEDLVVNCVHS